MLTAMLKKVLWSVEPDASAVLKNLSASIRRIVLNIIALIKSEKEGLISCHDADCKKHDDAPICKECKSPMSHIISLDLSKTSISYEGYIAVFQCQNDPGMCDDWDPNSGGNAVKYHKDLNCSCSSEYLSSLQTEAEDNEEFLDYIESIDNYCGKIEGEPLWIQDDETPSCACGKKMGFIAQVEERAHTSYNFGGGGCSYIFHCQDCKESKFLWQR